MALTMPQPVNKFNQYTNHARPCSWRPSCRTCPSPQKSDQFSFGLWTVGWQARDPFGDATRPALDPVETVHRLAERGAYGVTFHDDDLIPFGSDDTARAEHIGRFKKALDETGLIVPMATTNLFTHPVFKDGGVHQQRPRRAPLRAAQGDAQHRPGRRAGRQDLRAVGRPRGRRVRRGQGRAGRARPLPRGPGHAGPVRHRPRLRPAVRDRAQAERAARRHPAADDRARAGLHLHAWSTTRWSASTPRSGHEQMAGLNFVHGIAQALWHGKLFHIDLNGQRGIKYDQDLVFGHGDLINAFFLVDLLEFGGPDGGRAYDGPRHFDYKPSRTEDIAGVWASAEANMRTYLLLKERAAAYPGRPRGAAGAGRQPGGRAVRADPRRRRVLSGPAGRPVARSRSSTSDGRGARGVGFVALNQLALEHLSALAAEPRRIDVTLVAGVDSSTQSCKVVVRDAETGALVRAGPGRPPGRHRGAPARVVGGAAGGHRRGRRARRRRRRLGRRAAARHGLPRRGGRGGAAGPAVERHPLGPGRRRPHRRAR